MGERTLTLKRKVDIKQRLEEREKNNTFTTGDGHAYRCYILIGLPCSGKSTWVNSIIRNWKYRNPPAIVCDDDVINESRFMTEESYNDALLRFSFDDLNRAAMQNFYAGLGVHRDIIIDRHNLSCNDREMFLAHLPSSYQKIGIIFSLPERLMYERLTKRFEETGQSFSKTVIATMKHKFEQPSFNEFDRTTEIDHLCHYK